MTGATLTVIRINDNELSFVLQWSQANRPAVTQARTILRVHQRDYISKAYEDFAKCLEGYHTDEPKFRELGQVMFAVVLPMPIREQLRKLDEPLTILTDDPSLPWEILHDDEEFLALKLPISRQLIVQDQMSSLLSLTSVVETKFSALIIADPTDDLPGARNEGETLRDFFQEYGECDYLVGNKADSNNIQRHLIRKPYSIIHYCGHVDYDPNELLSTMRLHKSRLSPHDVLPTFQGNPVVFLNACYSDFRVASKVTSSRIEGLARTESFAHAFMLGSEKGIATSVIGAMWQIPDEPEEAGRKFSKTFYKYILQGESIGEALRKSRCMARECKWGPMVWGPYILYGDPCLSPLMQFVTRSKNVEADSDDQKQKKESHSYTKEQTSLHHRNQVEEKLKGADPLDTTARRVFHIAINEMKQMDQGGLSSLHLLIGLCNAEITVFDEILKKYKVDVEQLCQEIRERAKKLLPSKEKAFGMTISVLQTLYYAAKLSKESLERKITGEFLLIGLMYCKNCAAIKNLANHNISHNEIIEQINRSKSDWHFDKETKQAFEHAIRCALNAHLDYLGTPHLLIGLIQTGGLLTIKLLRKHQVNLVKFCDYLTLGVGKGAEDGNGGNNRKRIHYRPRCYNILKRAQELSHNESSTKDISELHLLQAILEEQEGFTADALCQFGANPNDMLNDLGVF